MLRASSARSCQCLGSSRVKSGTKWRTRFANRAARAAERYRRDRRSTSWIAVMPTPKECRQHAEECLKLANETTQLYARLALLELAAEFREIADELERRSRSSHVSRPRAHHSAATPA